MRTPPNAGAPHPHSPGSKSKPVTSTSKPTGKLPHTRTPKSEMWRKKKKKKSVHTHLRSAKTGPASAEQWKELHSRVFCSGTNAGCCSAFRKVRVRGWQVQLWMRRSRVIRRAGSGADPSAHPLPYNDCVHFSISALWLRVPAFSLDHVHVTRSRLCQWKLKGTSHEMALHARSRQPARVPG